jgi:hypothetical protein
MKYKILLTIVGAFLLAFVGALIPSAVANTSGGDHCPTCGHSQDSSYSCVTHNPGPTTICEQS